LIFGEWIAIFFIRIGEGKGDFSNVPVWGPDQSQVMGTLIFNYVFVVTVPSWCNERKPSVSVNRSLWTATITSSIIYLLIGIPGAWAFKLQANSDIISTINGSPSANVITRIAVYLYPIVSVASSIPVYAIVMRYNIIENNIMRKSFANFWAVIFPWLLVLPFYTGSGLQTFMNWTSLVFNGVINYVIPCLLYVKIRNWRKELLITGMNSLEGLDNATPSYDPKHLKTYGSVGMILRFECCESKKLIPAPPHFALPWHCATPGPQILGYILAVTIIVVCAGTVIINIINAAN